MAVYHWGKVDFRRNPVTGQWSCAHCHAKLPNNHRLCKCRDKKKGAQDAKR